MATANSDNMVSSGVSGYIRTPPDAVSLHELPGRMNSYFVMQPNLLHLVQTSCKYFDISHEVCA